MATAQDLIRHAPFGRIAARKAVSLDVRRIAPVIHIAHRLASPLRIGQRIIFDHELVLILKGRGRFRIGQIDHAMFHLCHSSY